MLSGSWPRSLALGLLAILTVVLFQNCGSGFSSPDGLSNSTSSGNVTLPAPNPNPGPVTTPGPKDLATATWRSISTVNSPTENNCPSAVWTGTRMLVVGASHGPVGNVNVNAAGGTQVWSYDPKADIWTQLTTAARPPGRVSHTSVWDGTKLINFGGLMGVSGCIAPGCYFYETYIFDPANLTWVRGTDAPIVNGLYIARYGHASVWTGSRMLTYAGVTPYAVYNVAGAYDPIANSWSVPPAGPDTRSFLSSTMFGNKAYFWGGSDSIDYGGAAAMGFVDGLIFDNATQTWSRWTQASPLMPRAAASMASTTNQIIVWGGRLGANSYADGAVFEPANNTWKSLPTLNAPQARECAASVWTGEEFIVWGGKVNGVPSRTGGILK